MKKHWWKSILVLMAMLYFGNAFAFDGIIATPPQFSGEPEDMVVVPSDNGYAYMVPGVEGVYSYQGVWYRQYGGIWYSSSAYNGFWQPVMVSAVPIIVIETPPTYALYLPDGYQRVHYVDYGRHWRDWDRGRYWHRQSWYGGYRNHYHGYRNEFHRVHGNGFGRANGPNHPGFRANDRGRDGKHPNAFRERRNVEPEAVQHLKGSNGTISTGMDARRSNGVQAGSPANRPHTRQLGTAEQPQVRGSQQQGQFPQHQQMQQRQVPQQRVRGLQQQEQAPQQQLRGQLPSQRQQQQPQMRAQGQQQMQQRPAPQFQRQQQPQLRTQQQQQPQIQQRPAPQQRQQPPAANATQAQKKDDKRQ